MSVVQNRGPDLTVPLLRKERYNWSHCNLQVRLIYMTGIASSAYIVFRKYRESWTSEK